MAFAAESGAVHDCDSGGQGVQFTILVGTRHFLVNSKLHFGKYYFLKPGGKFWVKDLPIKSAFSKLTPLSEDNFVGIASKNRFFTYDAEDGKEIFAKNISAVDLKVAGDKTLVLDKAGKVLM